jgi:histidinol-phosphate aminotransferase
MLSDFFREDLKSFRPYEAENNSYPIRLNANESFINISKEMLEEIQKAVKSVLFNRYPDPNSSAVCKLYADYAGVAASYIIAGNGSDELIQMIANAFINPRDKVMMLNPSFSMYSLYTRIIGGIPVQYNLNEDFSVEVEGLISRVNSENIKILFIANPNNPTGGVLSRKTVEKIVDRCNCIVVIDEAYYEFYGTTVTDLIDSKDNLIVLRTCSKAMGMAGIRLGFLMARDILVNEIKKVKPPFNVNSVTQAVGEVMLKNTALIKRNISEIINEREYLLNYLQNTKGVKVYPSSANFILIETDWAEIIKEKALARGISLRGFKENRLKNCLRITVGSREENEAVIALLNEQGDYYE